MLAVFDANMKFYKYMHSDQLIIHKYTQIPDEKGRYIDYFMTDIGKTEVLSKLFYAYSCDFPFCSDFESLVLEVFIPPLHEQRFCFVL